MKYELGAQELNPSKGHNLYKAIFAEFFGIFILNFFGCAACTQSSGGTNYVLISLAFGLSVFMAACVSDKNHKLFTIKFMLYRIW